MYITIKSVIYNNVYNTRCYIPSFTLIITLIPACGVAKQTGPPLCIGVTKWDRVHLALPLGTTARPQAVL